MLDFLHHGIGRGFVAIDIIDDDIGARAAHRGRWRPYPANTGIGACYEGFLAAKRS